VRLLILFTLLYVLSVLQAGLMPVGPDLALLALLVAALHEHRLAVTALGAFTGLVLDLTNPTGLGSSMLALAAVAYATAAFRSYFYRARWFILIPALLGVLIRLGLQLLAGVPAADPVRVAVSAILTVALSPLADRLLTRLFYHRWKPA
jgi:rod shape-determining protein MreD